jgi:hypothetical protein
VAPRKLRRFSGIGKRTGNDRRRGRERHRATTKAAAHQPFAAGLLSISKALYVTAGETLHEP